MDHLPCRRFCHLMDGDSIGWCFLACLPSLFHVRAARKRLSRHAAQGVIALHQAVPDKRHRDMSDDQ